jgi:Acyl-coenzyme A:6-aminopenicillanic acid acyl-transferase
MTSSDSSTSSTSSTTSVVAGGGEGDFLTVRHLRLVGSNRCIGHAMATAAKTTYGTGAGPHASVDPTVQRARRHWFAGHHPALTERMVGIADAFDVAPEDDSWDLSRLGPIETPAGCSAVFQPGTRTQSGHPLLGRNFDFPTGTYSDIVGRAPTSGEGPLAADPWVLELHPDNGYATIVVGIMDMSGGMDGINEAGLAVTLLADNESPAAEPSVVPQVGLSEQQIVRYLLESCRDVGEAKQALLLAKQYYIFVPCHFLVADASGHSFVWEYSPGHNREHIVESRQGEPVVCTNHLLHRWPNAAQLPNDPVSAGTAAFTYDRWRALDARAMTNTLLDGAQLRDHLDAVRFAFPTPGVRTLWQAVYDLHDASIELSFFTGDRNGVSQYTAPLALSVPRATHQAAGR